MTASIFAPVTKGDTIRVKLKDGTAVEGIASTVKYGYVEFGDDIVTVYSEDVDAVTVTKRALPTTPGYYEAVDFYPLGGPSGLFHPYRLTLDGKWMAVVADGFSTLAPERVRTLGRLVLLGSQAPE